MRHSACFVFAAVLIVAAVDGAAAQSPADTAVRLFAVQYSDGRTTKQPLRDSGLVSWTPAFPRIAGAKTDNDGLPLTALQFEQAVDGQDRVVTIALLYGTPHQKRVAVTTVRLSGDRAVRVDELTAFGVQPVTLAIASVPRPQLPIPTVTTPSSLLETTVEPNTTGAPRYRINVTNHAQQGVMAFAFEAYRGKTRSMSGKPHAPGHTPLISPGESYTLAFDLSPNGRSTGPGDLWQPIDLVAITSVTWSDGIVEGSERPALETRVVDAASARQLGRALALMRGAQVSGKADLEQLRGAISSLPIGDPESVRAADSDTPSVDEAAAVSLARIGTQLAKNALLNDFDEFLRDPRAADPAACRAWLASAVSKFDGWRTRILTAPR